VADTPELRAAYNAALPKVTEFWTRLGADERLYAKYKAIDTALLNPEQRQAHKNAMRNFVLGGAELTGTERNGLPRFRSNSAALSQKFSENTLDATDAFAYYATAEEMDGVPDDVKQTALRCRAGRRQSRLQADTQNAVLPARDAVCHSSAAASHVVPGLRYPRIRSGRRGYAKI
jgi:Zn-dependent oligopeptidase